MAFSETGLWADVRELPGALSATLGAASGVAEGAEVLRGAQRIVATGNGAAYYVAHALWLTALEGGAAGPPIVAVPCGLAVREGFRWQPGDAVLAVSSSGEFRDVVEIARGAEDRPCVAITASADSSLAAAATATVLQHVGNQRAVTHTQALSGAYGAGLALWAAVTGDDALAALLATAPEAAARAVADAEPWAEEQQAALAAVPPPAGIVVGGGPAWAAAMELALMLKEVSRIPAEGVETREGATSAMFGLAPGHLMVSLDPAGDEHGEEALRLCAATGATTLRFPVSATADARLALITTLPASAALSAVLAIAAGHDVDKPTWTGAYYETARSAR
jgi:glucosamine--fructose-6-phosphate aminotransferase (isomerizing)